MARNMLDMAGDVLLHAVLKSSLRALDDLAGDLGHHPPGNASESWQKCSELVEKYDKGLCEAFREQIDTLLVFAGLFSAVVTAFTIESYQWLHDDSGDVSAQLLAQIASRLDGTTPAAPVPPTSALSDASAARINIYWFLSLTLSLSAALIGILAKQWVRDYERDAGRTHPEAIGVRQMKFEGLEAWRVSDIISGMPLLLQMALILFFIGVVELLWHLNVVVAIPITIAAVLVLGFYLVTTFLPAAQLVFWYLTPASRAALCPFKSPQAWLAVRGALALMSNLSPRKRTDRWSHHVTGPASAMVSARSWIALDLAWTNLSDGEAVPDRPEYRYAALQWLYHTADHPSLHTWIWHCLWQCTSVPHVKQRSPANILSCAPSWVNNPCPNVLPLPAKEEEARRLLVPYASVWVPKVTFLDLICRMYNSFEDESFLDDAVDAWFAESMSKITISHTEVSINLSNALFSVVRKITERNMRGQFPGKLMGWFVGSVRYSPESHRSLAPATCVLARRWLNTDYSQLDEQTARSRVDICKTILGESMLAVRHAGGYHVEARSPHSVTTVVFASLARAIDAVRQRLPAPVPSWRGLADSFDDAFGIPAINTLLRIAASMESADPGPEDVALRSSAVLEFYKCLGLPPEPSPPAAVPTASGREVSGAAMREGAHDGCPPAVCEVPRMEASPAVGAHTYDPEARTPLGRAEDGQGDETPNPTSAEQQNEDARTSTSEVGTGTVASGGLVAWARSGRGSPDIEMGLVEGDRVRRGDLRGNETTG